MRIDDENKVVWCSEKLYEKLNGTEINHLSAYQKVSKLMSWNSFGGIPLTTDNEKWEKLFEAVAYGYDFLLEHQKYYWRKKKEHLASFEEEINVFLCGSSYSEPSDFRLFIGSVGPWRMEISEQEAKELLKDDFNMFEKVEID